MTITRAAQNDRGMRLVPVAGAGLVPWGVLTWLGAAERLGVRFRVVCNRLLHEPGEFSCIGGLPPSAWRFLTEHEAAVQRVVLATPTRLM